MYLYADVLLVEHEMRYYEVMFLVLVVEVLWSLPSQHLGATKFHAKTDPLAWDFAFLLSSIRLEQKKQLLGLYYNLPFRNKEKIQDFNKRNPFGEFLKNPWDFYN